MSAAPHLYRPGYAAVLPPAVADYLVHSGLPATHVLFGARETRVVRLAERELLGIGSSPAESDGGDFYADCGDGSIVFVDRPTLSLFHVNDSPRKFAECLAAFDRAMDVSVEEPGAVDPERQAERLATALREVDPSALADEQCFWLSVLADVMIGDYAN
jgi:hypothetical protein